MHGTYMHSNNMQKKKTTKHISEWLKYTTWYNQLSGTVNDFVFKQNKKRKKPSHVGF